MLELSLEEWARDARQPRRKGHLSRGSVMYKYTDR